MSTHSTGRRGNGPKPVVESIPQRSSPAGTSTGAVRSRAELRAKLLLTETGTQDAGAELSVRFANETGYSSICPGKSQEQTNATCRGIEERLKDNLIPWRRGGTSEEDSISWGEVAEKARDWLVATPASEARMKFGNFDWSAEVEVIGWDEAKSVFGSASSWSGE